MSTMKNNKKNNKFQSFFSLLPYLQYLVYLFCAVLFAMGFCACNSEIDPPPQPSTKDTQQYIIKGTLTTKGATSKAFLCTPSAPISPAAKSTRLKTALPSSPSGTQTISYTLTATKKGESPSSADPKGTIDDTQSPLSYEIALTKGNWTLTAQGFQGQDTSDQTKKIYTGSLDLDLSRTDYTPLSTDTNITLSAVATPTGKGNICLPVTIEQNTNITDINITCEPALSLVYDSTNNVIKQDNVTSGTYSLALDFVGATGQVLYSVHESLLVFDNMTTDFWQKNSSPYIDANGGLVITKALVDKFLQTTFYVAPSTATPAGNNTNSGSFFAPFETVQKAIDVIQSINDAASLYTILLKDDIENPASCQIELATTKKLNLIIKSSGSSQKTITAATGKRVMSITDAFEGTFKLQNLILTGGDATTQNGGALFVEGGGLTLENCQINSNTAAQGGGIYAKGNDAHNATIDIKQDCKINSNTSTTSGGAISVAAGAVVNIYGGVQINSNTATTTGGAIYVLGSGKLNLNGTAQNKITIQGNTALTSGGALNLACSGGVKIDGVDFISNQATSTGATGDGGALNINGSVNIASFNNNTFTNNSAGNNGGAICLGGNFYASLASYPDSVMQNLELKGNTAGRQGSGIYVEKGKALRLKGKINIGDATNADCVYLAGDATPPTSVAFVQVAGGLSATSYVNLTPQINATGTKILDSTITGSTYTLTPSDLAKFNFSGLLANTQVALDSPATSASIQSTVIPTQYYVDFTNGNNSNAGSLSLPFSTVQKALDVINSINDTTSLYKIHILTGGQPSIDASVSSALDITTTATALNLLIDCVQSDGATASSAILQTSSAFSISGAATKVILQNISLKGSAGAGLGLVCKNGANVTLKSCNAIDIATGIALNINGAGTKVSFEDCNITGTKAKTALYVAGGAQASLKNCQIKDNKEGGIDIEDATVSLDSCTITGNTQTKNNATVQSGICLETSGCILKLSGAINVGSATDANYIYLPPSAFITVEDALQGSYINVSPDTPDVNLKVLSASSAIIDTNLCSVFHLANTQDYEIAPNATGTQGTLKQKTTQQGGSITINDPLGYILSLTGLPQGSLSSGQSNTILINASVKDANNKALTVTGVSLSLYNVGDQDAIATGSPGSSANEASIALGEDWPPATYQLVIKVSVLGNVLSTQVDVTLQ